MAEEVKIHPGVIVGAGLLLGVGGILLYALRALAAPPVFTCPYCGATFGTQEELDAHISDEHPEVPPPGLANLYGRVTDAQTGNPIAGVLLTLNRLSVVTDSDGNFAFLDLTPGPYSVSASKEGYHPYTEAIALVGGSNELNIVLEPITELPAYIAVSVIAGTDLFKYFLQGALVSIDDRSGYTGKLGSVAFPELAAGTYSVTCSYNNWLIDSVYYIKGGRLYEGSRVTINPGEEISMRFVMKPRPWEE